MAALTATLLAGVALAVGVKGQRDVKKAQQAAAAEQERASIESAEQLAKAGVGASEDVRLAAIKSAERAALGTAEAKERILPFVDPGVKAFDKFSALTLSGQPISGPLAESIRLASVEGSQSPIFARSDVTDREILRQGGLNVSGLTPGILGSLQSAGSQGIAAAGDVASIEQRGLDVLSDIAGATGAQRGSALTGSIPQLQQLAGGAGEARLLSDVVGQRSRAKQLEILSKAAGGLI